MKKFSIGEALSFGWRTMKVNFWFFAGLLLVTAVLMVVLPGLIDGFKQQQEFTLKAAAVGLAQAIIGTVISIGFIKIALLFVDGQKPGFGDLFSHGNLFINYLVSHILYSLIVMAGMVLLVVPGIIWAIKYRFYDYFVVDKGMNPVEALKHSARVTAGAKWQLFWFGLCLVLINVVGALVFVVGLLATIPTSMLATAFVYRKLYESLEPAVVK